MSEPASYKKMSMYKVLQAVQTIREVQSDMQLETARLFMLIAMNPGITMRELQELSGQSQPTVSRNVTLMSEWKTSEERGLGLVLTKPDPKERRRKVISLTLKGGELASRLSSALN